MSKNKVFANNGGMSNDDIANTFVKVRYSLKGETKSLRMKDFWKVENEFLPGFSKFDDGFYGYYHKNCINETEDGGCIEFGDCHTARLCMVAKVNGRVFILETPEMFPMNDKNVVASVGKKE